MNKFAIFVSRGGQPFDFYPDPLYDSEEKALKKLLYLENYAKEHGMDSVFMIKELTTEEIDRHEKEWARFVDAID